MGGGVEFLAFVFDLNFQIGGLDVDRFGRFTDHTSDAIKDLRSGLQLPLLQGLMKELGAHVLETREHVVAVTHPVLLGPLLHSLPIGPRSPLRNAFTFRVLINKRPSGKPVQLPHVETPTTILDFCIRSGASTEATFGGFLLLFCHVVYCAQ